jgi:hypothetical protein
MTTDSTKTTATEQKVDAPAKPWDKWDAVYAAQDKQIRSGKIDLTTIRRVWDPSIPRPTSHHSDVYPDPTAPLAPAPVLKP